MKKIMTILLTLCLLCSLTACGDSGKQNEQGSSIASAQELLETVWSSYGEGETFSVLGGDLTGGSTVDNAPGTFPLDDAAALDTTFGLPAELVSQVDDAASMVHMMNANTFTCGAFHLTDGTDRAAFAASLKDAVMGRQWLCGFPDTLLIVGVDNYVVSVFGADDLVQAFKTKLTAAYSSAEVLAEEALAF